MDVSFPVYGRKPDDTPARPSPKQRAFHAMAAIFKLFLGGVGAGKSHAGAWEFLVCVLENAQHLGKLRELAKNPRRKGGMLYLIGAPTYDLIEVGAWHHVTQFLDEFEIRNGFALDVKRWESHPRRIKLVTGDVLKFVSLKKVKTWAGATAAGGWIDEAALADDPTLAWNTFTQRLRDSRAKRRFCIATTTPRGKTGIVQLFADRVAADDGNYGIVTSTSMDNPGNPADYVTNMAATMSDYEYRQQVLAEVMAYEGAVYAHEFDEAESIDHRWVFAPGPPGRQAIKDRRKTHRYFLAIDWGSHYHALWIEHDLKTGADVVFDELTVDGVQDREFIRQVVEHGKTRWGLDNGDYEQVYCDYHPRDACKEAYRWWPGRVVHRRVEGFGDQWLAGVNTVKWRLRGSTGTRLLKFAPALRRAQPKHVAARRILLCLENYIWKEEMVQGTRVFTGRAVKGTFDHGPDALRYYCWIRYSGQRFDQRFAA